MRCRKVERMSIWDREVEERNRMISRNYEASDSEKNAIFEQKRKEEELRAQNQHVFGTGIFWWKG